MSRTDLTTPASPAGPARRGRRAVLAGFGLAVGAGVLALAAPTPASANEFPPKPTASITTHCNPGGELHYVLGNVAGLDAADFTIAHVSGQLGGTFDTTVLAGETDGGVIPAPEGVETVLTITSPDGMAPVSVTYLPNCYGDPTVDISTECGPEGYVITFQFDQEGPTPVDWVVTVGDVVYDDFPDDVSSFQTGEVAEDEAYEAVVTANGVVVGQISGIADCEEPEPEIPTTTSTTVPEPTTTTSTTVPEPTTTTSTTVPEPTTTTTMPTPIPTVPQSTTTTSTTEPVVLPTIPVVPTDPPQVLPADRTSPAPAPRALPRTGGDSTPLAATGLGLLLGGAVLVGLSRKNRGEALVATTRAAYGQPEPGR